MSAKFKQFRSTGTLGYLSSSLFADVCKPDQRLDAPFWLNENRSKTPETDNRPVFRDIFLEYRDPTGYKLAREYLGSIEHWNRLIKHCFWFRDALSEWNTELEAMIHSESVQTMMEIANDETHRGRLQAAKWLAEKGYKTKPESSLKSVGRPTKEQVAGEIKKIARQSTEEEDDRVRIGLVVNNTAPTK